MIPSFGYGEILAFLGQNYGKPLFIVQVIKITSEHPSTSFDYPLPILDERWEEICCPNKNQPERGQS